MDENTEESKPDSAARDVGSKSGDAGKPSSAVASTSSSSSSSSSGSSYFYVSQIPKESPTGKSDEVAKGKKQSEEVTKDRKQSESEA